MSVPFCRVLGSAVCLTIFLVGCERYTEVPECRQHFTEGDVTGYQVDTLGTATAWSSGLVWYRCNGGQRFADGQCLGVALKVDQREAEAFAAEMAQRSGKPWRLPTYQEMATLRESVCRNPTVNTQVFPSALTDNYRTSSRSPNGERYSCTHYTYQGISTCRESAQTPLPFMLVLDQVSGIN